MAEDAVSREIVKIRLKAGWPGKLCPTCGKGIDAPYRRVSDRGHVTEGCVDASHTGRLYGESARWQNRPEAKAIRKSELAALKGGGRTR